MQTSSLERSRLQRAERTSSKRNQRESMNIVHIDSLRVTPFVLLTFHSSSHRLSHWFLLVRARPTLAASRTSAHQRDKEHFLSLKLNSFVSVGSVDVAVPATVALFEHAEQSERTIVPHRCPLSYSIDEIPPDETSKNALCHTFADERRDHAKTRHSSV